MATLHDGRQHLQAWQISGLSETAYCQQFELNPKTFLGWRRRYSVLLPHLHGGIVVILSGYCFDKAGL